MSRRHYLAYLVRLWREEGDDRTIWRASVEDPHTAERRGFSDLSRLFEFLRQQTETASREPDDQD
jgi:hypothetical protein